MYIHIKKDLGDVTGANIGIDYNYKLFFIFTGIQKQEQVLPLVQFIMILIPIIISCGVIFVLYKKRKQRKTIIPPTPSQAEINKVFPKAPRESVEDAMRQKIDMLTQKDRRNND